MPGLTGVMHLLERIIHGMISTPTADRQGIAVASLVVVLAGHSV